MEEDEHENDVQLHRQSKFRTRETRPCGKVRVKRIAKFHKTWYSKKAFVVPGLPVLMDKVSWAIEPFTVRTIKHGIITCLKPKFVAESDFVKIPDEPKKSVTIPRSVFDRFVLETRSGNVLRASMDLIDSVEESLEDIPIRNREWFRANACAPPNITDPSPAFELPDWTFAKCGSGPSSNFCTNLRKVVESAIIALNLQMNMPDSLLTKAAKKKVFHDVTWNPYVIYATTMKDDQQFLFEGNEQYFARLYLLRSRIGLNGDYGFKEKLDAFVGEGSTPSSFDMKGLFDFSGYDFKNSRTYEVICAAVDKVWNAVASIMSLITDLYSAIMEKIKRFLIRAVLKLFSLENVKSVSPQLLNQIVMKATLAYAVLYFIGSYVLSYQITRFFIKKIQTRFAGEAEVSPVTLVTTIAAAIFGLTTKQESSVLQRARYVAGLLAGGTVVANLGACAFTLFPTVIQDSLAWKFGSEEYRLKYQVGNWRSSSNAVLQFSTVPRVVGSPYFAQQIEDRVREGAEILDQLSAVKYSGLRSIVLGIYLKIQKIRMRLNQFRTEGVKRQEPFVMHVCGPSGVGKTMYVEYILQRLGYTSWYEKTIDDEFFPGYLDQEVLMMDEFLVGDQQCKTEIMKLYLTAASSAPFRVKQASMDDPLVGVKGQTFNCSAIVTINNTPHDRVIGFDDSALQRRRDVVVQIRVHKDFEKYCTETPNGLVLDLKKVPAEDLKLKKHIQFRVIPSLFFPGWENMASPWTNFDNVCRLIASVRDEKRRLSAALASTNTELYQDTTPPEELINEELRRTCSIPGKPVGILEAMTSLFTHKEEFQGEGKAQREHKCDRCGFIMYTRKKNPICKRCEDHVEEEESKSDDCSSSGNETPEEEDLVVEPDAAGSESDHSDHPIEEDFQYGKIPSSDGEDSYSDYDCFVSETFARACSDRDKAWYIGIDPPESVVNRYLSKRNVLVTLAIVSLLIGTMYGISRWLSSSSSEKKDTVSFGVESEPRKKSSHKAKGKSRWTRGEIMHGEGPNNIETCWLDLECIRVQVIPIAGRWLMTFAHCLFAGGRPLAPGSLMTLTYRDHQYSWKYDPADAISCKDPETGQIDHDLLFLAVGCPQCPQFKNIISRFLNDDQFPEEGFDMMMRTREGLRWSTARRDVQPYSYGGQMLYLNDGFRYRTLTAPGDCGSPIMVSSGKNINRCAGIHVAGTLDKAAPVGLAVRVSVEMIMEAIGEDLTPKTFCAEAPFLDRLTETSNPNLLSICPTTFSERVHMCDQTKLQRSIVAEHLPYELCKEPAIMSRFDPRSQGLDPVEESILRFAKAPKVKLDPIRLHKCSEEIVSNLQRALDYSGTGGLRELTFEEALFGIPGVLSPVVTCTSAGSPYCYFTRKRGKRELVWFDEGQGKYNPLFREHVEALKKRVQAGESYQKVFIGYMKDEVRSKKKIRDVNTRITFCDDVTYNVVCRMLFGSMVAAFNCSFPRHPYAIGINPGSHDFMKILQRLRRFRNRVVDGDFTEFDLRHQRQIMDESFWVLKQLGMKLKSAEVIFEHVRQHETCVPLLMGEWKIETVCNNASGGFWTTILNCITCDEYFRYAFKGRFPAKIFDDNVALVILGDDHLAGLSDNIEWNPLMIRDDMAEIGQIYTSSIKDRELDENYHKFSEVNFLGHSPQIVDGEYSGALRKETLEGSILWTRNSNLTIRAEVQQMVEYASQWDEEYYEQYLANANYALEEVGLEVLQLPPWSALRTIVASRTVDSGEDYRFHGEAEEPLEVDSDPGLTTVSTDTQVQSQDSSDAGEAPEFRSVSEVPASLEMGPSSFVKRGQWNWSSTAGMGTVLASIAVPFGLLGMGDQNNLQNMPFQNFLYSKPEVEVMVQLNGAPTQAGCLLVFYVPLSVTIPFTRNWPMMLHVKLLPSENGTATLKLPFRFWRTFLDNQYAQDDPSDMTLGKLHLGVYSPLQTKTAPSDCGVTVYSRVSTQSRIPRGLPVSKRNSRPSYGFTSGTGTLAGRLLSSDVTFLAEGSNISTTNVTTRYNVGSVAGGMPVEAPVKIGGTSQTAKNKVDAKTVPLDNPPFAGGALPTMQQFGSMSKVNGPEVTIGLGLHPEELSRQPLAFRDPSESSIEGLTGRFGKLQDFSWSVGQADGTDLFSLDLGSLFLDDKAHTAWLGASGCPANVAVLNQFKFIHCDVVYRFHAVRTKFHSGRLIASVGYGCVDTPPALKQALYTQVMDFNNDSSVVEVVVPYNNTQEYIRAFDNTDFLTGSTRFGSVYISVLNELRCSSEVVADSVTVIVEVAFRNVRVAVPNPYPTIAFSTGPNRMVFAAEAEDVNIPSSELKTTATTGVVFSQPSRIDLGEKFEYVVTDIHELVRRYNFASPSEKVTVTEPDAFGGVSTVVDVITIPVEPTSIFNDLYTGWSGTLKFRIFAESSSYCTVTYVPCCTDDDFQSFMAVHGGSQTVAAGIKVSAPMKPPFLAREVMYPVGSMSYIDVSVPFYNEYNMLACPRQDGTVITNQVPRTNGVLLVRVPSGVRIHVYSAGGDDFRYHCFVPDYSMVLKLAVGIEGPHGGARIGTIQEPLV